MNDKGGVGIVTWSPGISLRDVLNRAPIEYIRNLLGNDICALLNLITGGSLEDDQLRFAAATAIDIQELIAHPSERDGMLRLLPGPKQKELAVRLGADTTDTDPTTYLSSLNWTAAQRRELLEFLGLTVEQPPPRQSLHCADCNPDYGLFPHQRRVAEQVRQLLYDGPRRVVLHLPTGVGKTRTAMNIIADHLRNREPTLALWLAHGQELLEQATAEFQQAWPKLGNRGVSVIPIWGDASFNIDDHRDGIVILGLEKAVSAAKSNPKFLQTLASRSSITIFDEAHQIIAPTFQNVVEALTIGPNASLLGLTATPGRTWANITEDERLSEFFSRQKVMLRIDGFANPVTALIDQGYLAKPIIRTVASEAGLHLSTQDQRLLARSLDIPPSIITQLTHDKQWNLKVIETILDLLERKHRRIIVFTASVEHCRLIAAVLSARGFDADFVTGKSSNQRRNQAISRFKGRNPHPMILCNFGVLTTGFDAPAASAAVIARPTTSLVLYSQMIGRVIRGPKAGGTDSCEIVTVVDPELPGFGDIADAFINWEDVWESK